jgi:hypothetical protein
MLKRHFSKLKWRFIFAFLDMLKMKHLQRAIKLHIYCRKLTKKTAITISDYRQTDR